MPPLLCKLSFISSTVGQGLIITYWAHKIHKEWGEVWSIRTIYTQAHHRHPCHVEVWRQMDRKWRRTGSLARLGRSGLLLNHIVTQAEFPRKGYWMLKSWHGYSPRHGSFIHSAENIQCKAILRFNGNWPTTWPATVVWDRANFSCAYDALFTILYNIWHDNPAYWGNIFQDANQYLSHHFLWDLICILMKE